MDAYCLFVFSATGQTIITAQS